jgi:hypothetical protein
MRLIDKIQRGLVILGNYTVKDMACQHDEIIVVVEEEILEYEQDLLIQWGWFLKDDWWKHNV